MREPAGRIADNDRLTSAGWRHTRTAVAAKNETIAATAILAAWRMSSDSLKLTSSAIVARRSSRRPTACRSAFSIASAATAGASGPVPRTNAALAGSLTMSPSGVTLPSASPASTAANAVRNGGREAGSTQSDSAHARSAKRRPAIAMIGMNPQPIERRPFQIVRRARPTDEPGEQQHAGHRDDDPRAAPLSSNGAGALEWHAVII